MADGAGSGREIGRGNLMAKQVRRTDPPHSNFDRLDQRHARSVARDFAAITDDFRKVAEDMEAAFRKANDPTYQPQEATSTGKAKKLKDFIRGVAAIGDGFATIGEGHAAMGEGVYSAFNSLRRTVRRQGKRVQIPSSKSLQGKGQPT